jgi:hypothetical protein
MSIQYKDNSFQLSSELLKIIFYDIPPVNIQIRTRQYKIYTTTINSYTKIFGAIDKIESKVLTITTL